MSSDISLPYARGEQAKMPLLRRRKVPMESVSRRMSWEARAEPLKGTASPRSHMDSAVHAQAGPTLPDHVAVSEIDKHLDRVALAIAGSDYGLAYVGLFAWLEAQLHLRRMNQRTVRSIKERVRRRMGRTAKPS